MSQMPPADTSAIGGLPATIGGLPSGLVAGLAVSAVVGRALLGTTGMVALPVGFYLLVKRIGTGLVL